MFTSSHTRLPSESTPEGTKPKSTERLLSALVSPSFVGSAPVARVTGPLRTAPPMNVTPLSSLFTSLFGAAELAMSVLDVAPGGGTTSTK